MAGPPLTQTIEVNKYRGEVIDSYTNATDEEMKQFNEAKNKSMVKIKRTIIKIQMEIKKKHKKK